MWNVSPFWYYDKIVKNVALKVQQWIYLECVF